jgi:ribosomal protein L11 methyltransferase
LCGDIDLIEGKKFDLILANINKNILKSHMNQYANALNPGSKLALSGFFESDVEELISFAKLHNFNYHYKLVKETWAALILIKN